jgi:hypothetical protein
VVFGKDRHIVYTTPDEQVREIFGGQHGQYPRQTLGGAGIDADNACMGQGAT